ncbi:MAG: 30S ribosomal protein S20 [Spirochaetaceae bacterium]|nr:30S ribosomal protein S20 [Spirochaetaceae bacterium]
MANNRSSKKRVKQSEVRRMRNRAVKSAVRTEIKKFDKAVLLGDKESAKLSMDEGFKLLDGAGSKGVMHKNTTSRKKSRMYKAYSKLA